MINKSMTLKFLTLNIAIASFVVLSGFASDANAQSRDPFAKPGWARTKDTRTGTAGTGGKAVSSSPVNLGVPAIDQRIEFYKRLREDAAANGRPLPKVTSVLTLNEMAVTGIFRTPRGYAAMVEAMPIKLTYTIYPGEKFFDGQLVAVEENRLVFRRVSKMSNGKFISSVENKALRKYSEREQIQGTAPAGSESATTRPAAMVESSEAKAAPTAIVSPLDEMNKQMPADSDKSKSAKGSKKPVRTAKNRK
ncbi:MAG: hypothetical protein ACT4O9_00710 [Blastocatellia bacterium]